MVAPISGPFNKTTTLKGPVTSLGYTPTWFTKITSTYKQKRPFDRPLGYSVDIRQVTSFSADDPTRYVSTSNAPTQDQSAYTEVVNKCYGKFADKARYHSSLWATNLLEAGSAMDMIVGRLTQIHRASKAIRRFNFYQAGKILLLPAKEMERVHKVVGKRKSAKDFGANWLEYHFGWEPLLADIHEALDTFCDPYPLFQKIRVNSQMGSSRTYIAGQTTSTETNDSKVAMGAELWVNNPNTLLMNQMGFINPASIVWEAIPFSFVVDWFTNVGQVLSAYTDFVGLNLKNSWTTKVQQRTRFDIFGGTYWIYPTPPAKPYQQWLVLYTAGYKSFFLTRQASITGPTLSIKPFRGVSAVRGLTATSLLVQFLKG